MRICGGACPLAPADLLIHTASVGDVAPLAGQIFVPIQEDLDGHVLVGHALAAGVSLALVSAGWKGRAALPRRHQERCVVVSDVLVAYRALAAHLRAGFSFPVLAIAGSNGKTTTKELVAALLEGAGLLVSKTPQTMNGFTGIPYTLCSARHHRGDPPDVLVLEIGIDTIGAMAEHARIAAPDVAVITALGVEHLDGLESEERAAEEELALFAAASRRVFVAEDPRIRAVLSTSRAGDVVVAGEHTALPDLAASVLRYRRRRASPSANEVAFSWHGPGESARRAERVVPMGGEHNARNFAAAMGAALALERVSVDALFRAPRVSVAVPSMRCQVIATAAGPTVVDDCYNASPASVRAALAFIDAPGWRRRPKHVVLGEMLDLGDASEPLHRALADDLPEARYVFVGEAMRPVAATRPGAAWLPRDASAQAIALALAPVPDGVVLVKGSRGVGLERVVRALVGAGSLPVAAPMVAVVGKRRDVSVVLTAAAIGRAGTGDVVALGAAALAAAPRGMRATLFTGFELEAGLTAPEGVAVEELQLALMAQPLLHLAEGGVAVFDADDPTTAVIRLAVPDHAKTVLFGRSGEVDVRWELTGDRLGLRIGEADPVSLVWPDAVSPRAAAAAVAVAHALGESATLAAAAVEAAALD